jgi:hypothetical protein
VNPGIGKTRLATAIADMADDYGVPTALGCAIDDPGMPPLWPWRGVGATVPAVAGALSAAVDSADGPRAAAVDSATARFLMFAETCTALAAAAAERGMLVVLEDLQWADRSSLLLLRHLGDQVAHARLLVVATFREATDTPLAEQLPVLLRAAGTRSIRLTGLSRQDIAQWLRRLKTGGDIDGIAGRLQAATGGNPLFVRMLAERGTSAVDDGLTGFPELRHLALARLGQLGNSVRELLAAASVLGERIDPPVLAEVTGLPAADVAKLLDQAVAQGILVSTPDTAGLSFAHALVRDAVYDEMAPSRRTALHEQAARALQRSGRGVAFPGRSPATGRDPAAPAGRRTAYGGPARQPGRRRLRSPTTRRPGSPPSR